jgi:isochorismate synthase
VTREPVFVLAGPGGVVIADGVHTTFGKLPDARAALASHSAPIIVGALPFDISQPAALIRPQSVQFAEALPDWPLRQLPVVRITQTIPDPTEHRARIGAALKRLRDPASGLHKVVLARALRLAAEGPLDVRTIVARLMANDAAANAYFVDLTAAGGGHSGAALVGASPELLVARRGEVGWCDQRGDGRWVVSIRCAQLTADRRTALAHSGGGIVTESDPDDEVDETTTKFNTILTALGVEP